MVGEGEFLTADEILVQFVNWLEKKGFIKENVITSKMIDDFFKERGM